MHPPPSHPPSFAGTAVYADGSPAKHARIAIVDLASGRQVDVVPVDDAGRFQSDLAAGDYALAVTSERGFAWIEKERAPNPAYRLALSQTCHRVTGSVTVHAPGARVSFLRKSSFTGDVFLAEVGPDGRFAACLPPARYAVSLSGSALSFVRETDVPASGPLRIEGFLADEVRRAPAALEHAAADLAGLVADVVARDPEIIGLGEATHGTGELVTERGALTLELARRAGVRLVLLEVDAIAAATLDDYVTGGEVDLARAVAALGFWVTDTYEFLHFLGQLRAYNATAAGADQVHVWGVDVQNTALPVAVLVDRAGALAIADDEQALLKVVAEGRGKPVRTLEPAGLARLDALLARLATPAGRSREGLLVAVAARSLATQLGYWEGDLQALYGLRRDTGMAQLATFITEQLGAPRACLWAHAAHVAKTDSGESMMGHNLAAALGARYYAIGFYLQQGSARAWDAAGAIGVISHPIPTAPAYTVEGAVMAAAGEPAVAWLAFDRAPAPLRAWLARPRFVRELGSAYVDEATTMKLRNMRTAFDGVAVIKTGHDSSPTPTGVRTADHD